MSRKALFAKRPKRVDLGDGDAVYVRSFTVAELLHVEGLREAKRNEDALFYTVRRCVCDANGDRLLTDDDSLDDLGIDTCNLICNAVNKVSIGGSVGGLAKNSEATG